LKVLILLHSLDKFAGGVERRTSELETNLPDDIKREYLLFKNIVSLPHKGKINFIKSLKIPKFILKNKKKLKFLAYFFGFLILFYRIYQVKKFLQNNDFNVILAIDDYFGLIGVLSGIDNLIVSVRNYPEILYQNSLIHLLPDFVYKKVYPKLIKNKKIKIHVVSKCIKKYLKEKYDLNSFVIYNLFEIEKIRSLAAENIEFDFEYFINIGHLNHQKNQKDLIYAYKILKEHGIKEKLLIIGDGEKKEELKNLIKELNLENDIFLLGKKENPYKYLKRAKFYISTSLYEGFPGVFVEANILKVPIISYNFKCGAEELAVYLSKKNPESLAKKILEVKNLKTYHFKNVDVSKNTIIKKWIKIFKEFNV